MTRAPADRSHLSIGEVLSLLQDEFPDVTISKIRFLESQGLLDPERTPSGYRKFYETDIERLRWILRQQKEHYLPLKVIKDRLDDVGPRRSPPGRDEHDERGDRSDRYGADAGDDRYGREDDRYGREDERPGTEAGARGERRARAATPSMKAPPPLPLGRRGSADGDPWRGAGAAARPGADGLAPPSDPPSRSPTPATPAVPAAAPAPRAPTNGTPPGAGRPHPAAPAGPAAPSAPAPPAAPAAPAPQPTLSAPEAPDAGFEPPAGSVSLTLDELAEASGVDVRDLRDLERFGLLEGHQVGDDIYYDGDALVVARTAGGFLQHGIQARHLRTYKVAVDREAGLFEQIVLPLLKQRNPEAHRRAARTLTELVHLGEVLRGVLLRRELRDNVGP